MTQQNLGTASLPHVPPHSPQKPASGAVKEGGDIQNLGALSSKGVNIAKKGSLQEIQIFKEYTNRLKLEISFNDFGVFFAAPPRLVSWPTSLLFSFTLLVLTAGGLFFGVAISKNPGGGVENPFFGFSNPGGGNFGLVESFVFGAFTRPDCIVVIAVSASEDPARLKVGGSSI